MGSVSWVGTVTRPAPSTLAPAGAPTRVTEPGWRAPPPKLTSLASTSIVTLSPAVTDPASSPATGALAVRSIVIRPTLDSLPSRSATR